MGSLCAGRMSPKDPALPVKANPNPTLRACAFADAAEWSAWLASHCLSSRGVWLKIAKKTSGKASVSYAEALATALVWGWIDGQKEKWDEAWWLQKFTPRGPRSMWSKLNREKATALIASGKMMPSGLAEVERAKRDGDGIEPTNHRRAPSYQRTSQGLSRKIVAHKSSLPSWRLTTDTQSCGAFRMRRSRRREPVASLSSWRCWRRERGCTRKGPRRIPERQFATLPSCRISRRTRHEDGEGCSGRPSDLDTTSSTNRSHPCQLPTSLSNHLPRPSGAGQNYLRVA